MYGFDIAELSRWMAIFVVPHLTVYNWLSLLLLLEHLIMTVMIRIGTGINVNLPIFFSWINCFMTYIKHFSVLLSTFGIHKYSIGLTSSRTDLMYVFYHYGS